MKKRILATALVACAFTAQAQVKTGPEIETLYPVGFHHDKGDGLYIEFQAGAMPGCHGGKGGRLSKSNPNYKEYYSLLLTMMTTKSFKGVIRYENTNHTGWWSCSIEGIFVYPK
ncbi:hypothetical protein [Vibrio penaeicida]|uniref:Uncharacterized protein n=1 Tax=Vibrio penaeicida TaxID=104609 RepID=A0AAV5NVD4_9VIBR|nr:hypothetical protein [Vibrio penaeicida]RTZ19315.1 hypothetical protein EKN09_27635 [Vibrio penaeicida]GLQ73997.1 hypothetical protein GCM10007932_33570 [Vibrio penaeicida]